MALRPMNIQSLRTVMPVVGSKPLSLARRAISSSEGLGGGTLAWNSVRHCSLPSQGGRGAGGKGTISSSSGTSGFR